MHIPDDSPLRAAAYEFTHEGIHIRCFPASYVKGKMALQYFREDKGDSWKGRFGRLLDALNARYSNRSGYILAPTRALQFRELFLGGWDAEMDWRGTFYGEHKTAPLLESPDGRKMSLKEACAEIAAKKNA